VSSFSATRGTHYFVNFVSPGTVTDDPRHLTIVGKSTKAAFRKDDVFVNRDLENAVLALDQLDGVPEFTLQLDRQPGGPRPVVSNPAVFD